MRPLSPVRGLLAFLILALLGMTGAQAAMQEVPSHRPAALAKLTPLGRLDASKKLSFAIALPLRNQAELTKFLAEISDPKSPNYRHYLTPEQFTEKYGPTKADYQAVVNFAKANGLTVSTLYPNRMLVDVEGPVPVVEKALHVTMLSYQHPNEERHFFAPSAEPKLDLSVQILGISGLDNYALPQPRYKRLGNVPASPSGTPSANAASTKSQAAAAPNVGSGPGGGFMGSDFRTAYAPGVPLDGTGQVVGLLQFDGYTPSDITFYENKAGLPNVPIVNILLDNYNGAPTGSGGEVEVSLDIEMVMSMAPNVSAILMYEGGPVGNWHDILNRMANDNYAKQLSCSWFIPGGAMDTTADQIFQQMIAQGQSFYSASGDDDAFSGLIPFPGDTPYITEVGGTQLTTSGTGGTYVSEAAWNRNNGTGTGGGISTQYSLPSWQVGINMATNAGSLTMRNVPDVAMTAENVYVRADGVDQLVGGTSCAAPLWGGYTALLNQQAAKNGVNPVGFINPAIYALGPNSTSNEELHDTASGNNESTTSPLKFPCVTGYDLCTGWGAPAGRNLVMALTGAPMPIVTTANPLPPGAVNLSYSFALSAVGGTPGTFYLWAASSLPQGFRISPGGIISGAALSAGTYSVGVQVMDNKSNIGTANLSLTIYPQGTPVISNSSPLPNGRLTVAYNLPISISGGAAPVTLSLASGTMPPGLGISGTSITGTPTATGTYSFTLQAQGSDTLVSTSPFSITILAAPVNPTITTSGTLASGIKGQVYYKLLSSTGGSTPCTWAFSSGTFPPGLNLNSYGVISGTPTSSGTFNFNVTLTGIDGGSATAAYTITISPFGPLDHFVWNAIPSPQAINSPFSTTLTAQDIYNNTVGSFNSTATLSAGAPLEILNSPAPQATSNTATWTLGYSFTPSINMNVQAVRTYFGTKVSIWTNSGTLVTSTAVSGTAGQWTQTALSSPVTLQAGTTYRIAALSGGQNYYWRTDMSSSFPGGTIGQTWYTLGDGFPSSTTTGFQWFFVDLQYTLGPAVTVSPVTTGAFTSGVLTAPVTISQLGSGVVLLAANGGHTGITNPFDVLTPANLIVTPAIGYVASGPAGGPFTPASAIYTVGNSGNGSMNWTASNLHSWLTVSPSSGTLGQGATTNITASINTNAFSLPANTYSDVIAFTNTINGIGNTTRAVSLMVAATPTITSTPPTGPIQVGVAVSFPYTATGSPAPTFSLTSGAFPPGMGISSTGVLSGTPTASGIYTGTVTATNGFSPDAPQGFSITVLNTFSSWESSYFSGQQLADPMASGQNANPAHDGVPNLLKYLFDMSPLVNIGATDRAALPKVAITNVGGTNYLTLTYRQNPFAGGITVNVQTSPDLQVWTTVTPDLSQSVGTDAATNDPIMQVGVKYTGAAQEFIRLNVTSP